MHTGLCGAFGLGVSHVYSLVPLPAASVFFLELAIILRATRNLTRYLHGTT
jgi:hypothetical protein